MQVSGSDGRRPLARGEFTPADERDDMTLSVGLVPPFQFWAGDMEERRASLAHASDNGVGHLYVGDHVSFHDGSGHDGLITIAALSQLHPTLKLMVSTYLLPLRPPVSVARQLASMHVVAPGRLLFGVGIGGEDRNEVELCGVDPRTRGRRMDESIEVVARLLAGETFDYDGEFFKLTRASIKPDVGGSIPIIVGGRSDAALERAGRFGQGWVGLWSSPERYELALQAVNDAAERAGRIGVQWRHAYQPWVGIGDSRAEGRRVVASAMEAFYKVPFEKFERYVPYGTPDDVADQLRPYAEAGCRYLNLKICSASDATTFAAAESIATALR